MKEKIIMWGLIIIMIILSIGLIQKINKFESRINFYENQVKIYRQAYERKCDQMPIIDKSNYPYVIKEKKDE